MGRFLGAGLPVVRWPVVRRLRVRLAGVRRPAGVPRHRLGGWPVSAARCPTPQSPAARCPMARCPAARPTARYETRHQEAGLRQDPPEQAGLRQARPEQAGLRLPGQAQPPRRRGPPPRRPPPVRPAPVRPAPRPQVPDQPVPGRPARDRPASRGRRRSAPTQPVRRRRPLRPARLEALGWARVMRGSRCGRPRDWSARDQQATDAAGPGRRQASGPPGRSLPRGFLPGGSRPGGLGVAARFPGPGWCRRLSGRGAPRWAGSRARPRRAAGRGSAGPGCPARTGWIYPFPAGPFRSGQERRRQLRRTWLLAGQGWRWSCRPGQFPLRRCRSPPRRPQRPYQQRPPGDGETAVTSTGAEGAPAAAEPTGGWRRARRQVCGGMCVQLGWTTLAAATTTSRASVLSQE